MLEVLRVLGYACMFNFWLIGCGIALVVVWIEQKLWGEEYED